MNIPTYAARALAVLEAAGYESYAVGGCVRDTLLGREPHDWDLTTAAPPETVRGIFASERVLPTGLKHGTVTLLTEGGPLEITTFRTESAYSDGRHPDAVAFVSDVHEDLRRRDFTVNAMAYSPVRGLRDDFGGREDLRAGVLRCVGDPRERFEEDALRILRALRFAARYGFTVEDATAEAILADREKLHRISPERIFTELKGLLTAPKPGAVMERFSPVIFTVLPELAACRGFDQHRPDAHQYDVWGHILASVDAVPPDEILRLTMLFHDCGKPESFTLTDDGKGHFYGHPERGAALADRALRRLRCDNFTRETVVTLVTHHDFRPDGGKKSVGRLLARIGAENMARLYAVTMADAAAHTPETEKRMRARAEETRALTEEILREKACFTLEDLAVRGGDLVALGIGPGPAVGKLLRRLLEEVIDGAVPNEKEALLRRAEILKEEAS